MKIKQLSVFLENEKGSLAEVTRIFRENDIDIIAITVNDTVEYGILRMVVSNAEKAAEALKKEGFVAKISEILAINPVDRKGSLNEVFTLLGGAGVNIEYIYSFLARTDGIQLFVLKVDDPEKAAALLREAGVELITEL